MAVDVVRFVGGSPGRPQAGRMPWRARRRRVGPACLFLGLIAALLTGCGGSEPADPVDWWHGLEGGRISEVRPPPPNADQPYPNLGTVPARLAAPNAAGLGAIATALAADRASAQYAASAQPIPKLPAAAPRPAPARPPATPGDEAPNAALQAANAPPSQPATVSSALPTPPPGQPAAAVAAMPDMPAAPPPPPELAGVGVPAVTAPTPPPIPPPAAAAAQPAPGAPVEVAFPAASAVLPAQAEADLKALAARRGNRAVVVTGFGEAIAAAETAAQATALPLALDRARAVAVSLQKDGVPAAVIRLAAAPEGAGAIARLAD
jgi:outer membrane protein OmpA-like peptidoglycan-associated protein